MNNYLLFITLICFRIYSAPIIGGTVNLGSPVTGLLPPPPINTNYSCIYYTFDTTSSNQNYINIDYEPQRGTNYVIFSYIQIRISLPPSDCSLPPSKQNLSFVDLNGFFTNRNQFVSIQKSQVTSGTIVYPTIFFALSILSSSPPSLPFSFTITSSTSVPCPNNCNNHGQCKLNGQCICQDNFIGYDCSISPYYLTVGATQKFTITPLNYAYVLIPISTMVNNMNLMIQENTPSNLINLYFGLNGTTIGSLITIYQNSKPLSLSTTNPSLNLQVPLYSQTLEILIWNFDSVSVALQVSLSASSSVNILLIVMVVIGSVILLALIISIIYIVRKKRSERIQPQQIVIRDNPNQLTSQQIQTYFPTILYEKISNITQKNESNLDLVPTQDCVICLCTINKTQQVRITYCNHIFHKDCLTGWFQKQQNCPYCRESFDRQHITDLIVKIQTFYHSKFPNGNSNSLRGEDLINEIIDYYRNRAQEKQMVGRSTVRQISSSLHELPN